MPGDANDVSDIFVRDRLRRTTERVSVGTGSVQANGGSEGASISAYGRYVAFHSNASNLVPGDTNGAFDAFVRDRATGRTKRVSVSSTDAQASSRSHCPSISVDGRFIVFMSSADDLVPGETNRTTDIFVRDRLLGTTTHVSVGPGGRQANSSSELVAMAPGGHHVGFLSVASNLVPGGTNGHGDIFVRDLLAGRTIRVNVAASGAQASAGIAISAYARVVTFGSLASNLVPGDTNGTTDIFARVRWGADDQRGSEHQAPPPVTRRQGNGSRRRRADRENPHDDPDRDHPG